MKLLDIPHHFDDYECMWNGIEDLYIRETGETLPPSFFFVLAGFGSFCYRRTDKAALKRMVALGDGRTAKMYEFLAPIVGFEYRFYAFKTFERALAKVKAEIDAGFPCVLGALDMFHLPYYPKLYHGGEHIPFHYALATGYDDEAQCVYLSDCGRAQTQTLSYAALQLAWDCSYPGLSKPNTVCCVRMNKPRDKYTIAREAFAKRRALFLEPPVAFVGARGFERFISELPDWKKELTREDYDKLLLNMVTFLGTVPTVPNALRGSNEPDALPFGGGFDKTKRVLEDLGEAYRDDAMLKAGGVFGQGAAITEEIKNSIVAYLSGACDRTKELPALFGRLLEVMREGYEALDWEK